MYRRAVLFTLVALTLLSAPGCLGRFALTGGVRKFNLNVAESPWGREGVFLALYIIPVYPIAGFLDMFIVNSIEFWSGKNPLDGEEAIVLTSAMSVEDLSEAEAQRALASIGEDGSALLRVVDEAGEPREICLSAEEARRLLGRDPAEFRSGLALRSGP